MLPFLKLKKDASEDGSGGMAEPIEREHDEDYDMLAAVADDILSAIESKDKGLLKSALSALCEHMQDMDEQQDQSMMKE